MGSVTRHLGIPRKSRRGSRRLHAAVATALLAACAALLAAPLTWRPSAAEDAQAADSVEFAIAMPMTGEGSTFGQPPAEGAQLAIEEANAERRGPKITFKIYDDKSSDEGARAIAEQVVASRAAMVIGPSFSTQSLLAGPIYAQSGMVSLPPSATSDGITNNASYTTFRVVFKNSEQGITLANYLARVLKQRRANVIGINNTYGRSLVDDFVKAAKVLDIDAHVFMYDKLDEADAVVNQIVGDPSHSPVVLAILDSDGAPILARLRRAGVEGPFLGGDTFGDSNFAARFASEPEEQLQPGWFTRNLYGLAPTMFDSANADTLAFVERFRKRFGHDPTWTSVAGYDAARVAAEGVRRVAAANGGVPPLPKLRSLLQTFMMSLSEPARAIPALIGPIWFDATRGRHQSIRVGRFNEGRFESAPLQFVLVDNPNANDIASGNVFELTPGVYAKIQRVVYTGLFINEISRVDLQRSSFAADFYMWIRFVKDAGPGAADPTEIIFPNLIAGSFNRNATSKVASMADGTEYYLWRVQGEFRNDYDLHAFPFDVQSLTLPFFNARAAADQLVYVLDGRLASGRPNGATGSPAPAANGTVVAAANAMSANEPASGIAGRAVAAVSAFRNLTQWEPVRAEERRENLVTDSLLGEPSNNGAAVQRELSGFTALVQLKRRTVTTLTKNLLPLLLMTLIMFGSLYFPHGLVKEKVTVAITAALSGAVLLTAINGQLGGIGYTIMIEYVFYAFFALCVLCIISVLTAERLRVSNRQAAALRTEQGTRAIFLLTVLALVAGAFAVWT
ncbi:MAG TPA: ABC transporter substrate-binding protein [Xanthobacteraceae bacterium]|nr:ABC transporter substrate-binding protein [Xanthobacteraceae bacterium]